MKRRSDTRTFLGPAIANAFERLKVSAAIRDGGPWGPREGGWRPIHVVSESLSNFELDHGMEAERGRYNRECMNRVLREGVLVRGQHAGLTDIFAPLIVNGTTMAVLATGPLATKRPTADEIQERWHWLTRRHGHPSDPEFSHYLSVTLRTLVLEGRRLRDFERFVTCFAGVVAGAPDSPALLARAETLRHTLNASRAAEHAWEEVRSMLDERTERSWASSQRLATLRALGMSRSADHALASLVVGRATGADPIDEVLRRDELQRQCVELARSAGEAIAGQIGAHGVVFLAVTQGSGRQRNRLLLRLAERATSVARKLGFDLYTGLSPLPRAAPLSEHYRAAVLGAEVALSERSRTIHSAALPARRHGLLLPMRRRMAELAEQHPNDLPPYFERYLEAVLARAQYRIEHARAYLDTGFEDIAGALEAARLMDEKTLYATAEEVARAAESATTIVELFAVYRKAVAEVAAGASRPTEARHDRALRRAIAHIHRHYTEPVRRSDLAKMSGFAPNYFSELFRRQQGVSFERYLQKLRINRSKQLLRSTDLGLARVAELSGLSNRSHLGHVFRRAVGMTPLEWRRRR